jgi:uncharacterized protein (DUF2062 family)
MLIATPLAMMLAHYLGSLLLANVILAILSIAYFTAIVLVVAADYKLGVLGKVHVNPATLKKKLTGLSVKIAPTLVALSVPTYAAIVFSNAWLLAPAYICNLLCNSIHCSEET